MSHCTCQCTAGALPVHWQVSNGGHGPWTRYPSGGLYYKLYNLYIITNFRMVFWLIRLGGGLSHPKPQHSLDAWGQAWERLRYWLVRYPASSAGAAAAAAAASPGEARKTRRASSSAT